MSEREHTHADRDQVRSELGWLREFARGLRLDEVRDGTWFSRLLKHSMERYVAEVDADYFRRKYPGVPPDAVVEARIQLAARSAGIEGGLSAGAYTGAVAATLGSASSASPLTLPVAGASFVVDLLYLSQLQLRLAYDIAVLYDVPLDLEDPEDLWKLIQIAFVIKGGEAGRSVVGKAVPALVRPVLQRLYRGGPLAAARSLPVVGRFLLQRNVIKFGIPAVGVPLSVAVNYWSTKTAGAYAARVLRREAAIVAAARGLTSDAPVPSTLLWVLWMVIKADGLVQEAERLLLRHVTSILHDPESELAALAELEVTGTRSGPRSWRLLESFPGDKAALYAAAVEAAAIDGTININELALLRRLAPACGTAFDQAAIRVRAVAYGRAARR